MSKALPCLGIKAVAQESERENVFMNCIKSLTEAAYSLERSYSSELCDLVFLCDCQITGTTLDLVKTGCVIKVFTLAIGKLCVTVNCTQVL